MLDEIKTSPLFASIHITWLLSLNTYKVTK